MKVEVEPSSDPERLAENLRNRFESVDLDGDSITVSTDEPGRLSRVPGVKSFEVEGERVEGLGGEPLGEQAYCRIESRRDAVRAFLATVEGYRLVVLDTSREWDLRALKRYSPDIKQLDQEEPAEVLGVEKSVGDLPGEDAGIELPEEEDVERIYRKYLT